MAERNSDVVAEPNPGDALLAWSFPAFHTASLLVTLVLGLHLNGSLGEVLGGLGTEIGVVVFFVLWLTTAFTTRRALRRFTIRRGQRAAVGESLVAGILWGGANGALFLLLVGGVNAAYAITVDGLASSLTAYVWVIPFGLISSAVAFMVGALIASAYVLVDRVVLVLAIRIADRCAE